MENQIQNACRCQKTSCRCEGVAVERCTCRVRCACKTVCRCGGGCACEGAK